MKVTRRVQWATSVVFMLVRRGADKDEGINKQNKGVDT
jgi:hypothetical protein